MAVINNYGNDALPGAGVPGGYVGPNQDEIDAYYDWITQQQPNNAPAPVTDDWYKPYEYGGWRPEDEQGYDLPEDQYLDWYANNPDAQRFIDDWESGGSGYFEDTPPPPTPPPSPPPAEPPPADPPPVNYGPRGPYGTAYAPGDNWPVFNAEGDMEKLAQQDRLLAGAWADNLEGGFSEAQNRYENLEGQAREQAWNGMGGYANILRGEGGFDPTQSANILQEDMLRGGMAGDAEYDANFLTPEEIAAMSGNPYAARDMAAGKLTYLDQWRREGDAAQRGAVSALDTDLNAAVDPTKLTLSDEYKANFNFGQADADLMADKAGRVAGTSAMARDQQLRDAAFAHGNTSPIALEAARGRNSIYGDIASADAITDARLKGKGLMLDVTRSREQDRLDSERDLSGRQRDIASEIRQTQLGTEKGISDAWNDYGRYNTNLMVDTTGQAEAAAANRAGQVATNRQGANQANINTRFGQAGTASSALSGRYGQVYGQKKQEEAEGRKFLTDQQGMAQAGGQAGQDRRLNLYGARTGATGAATSRAIQAKNLPTWIDKGAGFVGGLLGG